MRRLDSISNYTETFLVQNQKHGYACPQCAPLPPPSPKLQRAKTKGTKVVKMSILSSDMLLWEPGRRL